MCAGHGRFLTVSFTATTFRQLTKMFKRVTHLTFKKKLQTVFGTYRGQQISNRFKIFSYRNLTQIFTKLCKKNMRGNFIKGNVLYSLRCFWGMVSFIVQEPSTLYLPSSTRVRGPLKDLKNARVITKKAIMLRSNKKNIVRPTKTRSTYNQDMFSFFIYLYLNIN